MPSSCILSSKAPIFPHFVDKKLFNTSNWTNSRIVHRKLLHWYFGDYFGFGKPIELFHDAELICCLNMIHYMVPHPMTGDADTDEKHDDGQDDHKDDDKW